MHIFKRIFSDHRYDLCFLVKPPGLATDVSVLLRFASVRLEEVPVLTGTWGERSTICHTNHMTTLVYQLAPTLSMITYKHELLNP